MSKKVLFVHDGPIGVYNKNVYGVHYKNELVDRYLIFGKRISFLMRTTELKFHDLNKYSLINREGVRLISIPNFKSFRNLHKKKEAKKTIIQAVKEHDVIIVRLPSAAGTIAFKEARRLNKPVLVEFVACVYDALWNYDWRGKLIAEYKLKLLQKLMLKATHTIYVTNDFLQNRYPTNGKYIGCSDVELPEINDPKLAERLSKIKETKTPLKLTTLAAIDVMYKGQADIINAIAQLRDHNMIFKYDIIGQGNPDRLQSLIDQLNLNDLVKIIGSVPHKEVFDYIENTDVYVQPSKTEGLPRAVVEAMSLACPVLGSDVGGIPELIGKEALFEAGNVKDIIKQLSNINNDKLKKMAIENFNKAKDFKMEALNKKRIQFYNEFKKDYNLS
jgi:glycosyltransferase involved in cell wall biosynthesis